jgi:hypothetical protein
VKTTPHPNPLLERGGEGIEEGAMMSSPQVGRCAVFFLSLGERIEVRVTLSPAKVKSPGMSAGENKATDAEKGWLNKKEARQSKNLGGKVL